MSAIKDGGSAFPVAGFHEYLGNGVTRFTIAPGGGMSLRDYFAAKAMHAVMTGSKAWNHVKTSAEIAEAAYLIADAMLAAREAKS